MNKDSDVVRFPAAAMADDSTPGQYQKMQPGDSFFYVPTLDSLSDATVGVSVLRVPGGWIHIIQMNATVSTVFVPLSDN
jgi:hypothetical protein